MPQKKILLDSNAYFRLARCTRPLLFVEFGEDKICLYVIEELELEFKKNPRLQNKFDWIMEKEYVDNRKNPILIGRAERKNIDNADSYIYAQGKLVGISKVDSRALATAHVLKIKLVSDDGGVREIANDMSIDVMTSLELLKIMLDCKYLTKDKIKEIVTCWDYENDLPTGKKQFIADYKKLFDEEPPDDNYEG